MNPARITMVVAMTRNRVIGRDQGMPWHLPADLRHFRTVTLDHSVLMGRRTFESIGRALPRRRNIVITRDRNFSAPGCEIAASPDAALALAGDGEIMVIGGGRLYADMLARCTRIHLTLIETELEGDTYFPALPEDEWKEVSREDHPADADNPHPYSFRVLERRTGA